MTREQAETFIRRLDAYIDARRAFDPSTTHEDSKVSPAEENYDNARLHLLHTLRCIKFDVSELI
jgi:hypothetical protein